MRRAQAEPSKLEQACARMHAAVLAKATTCHSLPEQLGVALEADKSG